MRRRSTKRWPAWAPRCWRLIPSLILLATSTLLQAASRIQVQVLNGQGFSTRWAHQLSAFPKSFDYSEKSSPTKQGRPARTVKSRGAEKLRWNRFWQCRALALATRLQGASGLDLPRERLHNSSWSPCILSVAMPRLNSDFLNPKSAKNSRESKYLFFPPCTTCSGLYSPDTLGIVSRFTSNK